MRAHNGVFLLTNESVLHRSAVDNTAPWHNSLTLCTQPMCQHRCDTTSRLRKNRTSSTEDKGYFAFKLIHTLSRTARTTTDLYTPRQISIINYGHFHKFFGSNDAFLRKQIYHHGMKLKNVDEWFQEGNCCTFQNTIPYLALEDWADHKNLPEDSRSVVGEPENVLDAISLW